MGSNLVIVALPADDDPVHKVSSEKVPHLTLLFLGDAENNPNVDRIFQFVYHAVNICEHGGFGLEVDHRAMLGEDKADVIHFRKDWSFRWINQFRNQLLQNSDIRAAYESTEQFPEWRPHLTLGYPETPANDDKMPEFGLSYVRFDRIAVWTGNYEGPWFRLEWPERESELAVAYSDVGKETVDDILEHFGVKGMQWGKRKTPSIVAKPKNNLTTNQTLAFVALGEAARLNKSIDAGIRKNQREHTLFRKDKKWEKDFQKAKGFGFDDQKFTTAYNAKWKDHDFSKENFDKPSPTYKKYMDGYFKEMNTSFAKQFADHYGESPSGKYEAHHVPGTDLVKLRKKDTAQHSLDDGVLVTFRIKRNAEGFISGLEQVDDDLEQSALELGESAVDDILEHYGVKGMQWGVRRHREGSLRRDASSKRAQADRLESKGIGTKKSKANRAERLRREASKKEAQADQLNRNIQKTGELRKADVAKTKSGLRKLGRGIGAITVALADSSWQSSTYSDASHEAVHNNVAEKLDTHIEKLQRSPKYAGKNLKADSDLRKTYYQDVAKVTDSAYRRAVKDVYGENISGTKTAHYVTDARGPRIEVRDKNTGLPYSESPLSSLKDIQTRRDVAALKDTTKVTHADTTELPDLTIELTLDDNGQISGVGFVKPSDEDELIQTSVEIGEAFVDDFLEELTHYGVKGMRWGVTRIQNGSPGPKLNLGPRREAPTAVTPVAISKVPHGAKRKTKIEVDGGQNHPAAEDAIKVAQARAKLAKSGPAALSNKELREVADRLRLEEQVTTMTRNSGSKFVRRILGNQGNQAANQLVKSEIDNRIFKKNTR